MDYISKSCLRPTPDRDDNFSLFTQRWILSRHQNLSTKDLRAIAHARYTPIRDAWLLTALQMLKGPQSKWNERLKIFIMNWLKIRHNLISQPHTEGWIEFIGDKPKGIYGRSFSKKYFSLWAECLKNFPTNVSLSAIEICVLKTLPMDPRELSPLLEC